MPNGKEAKVEPDRLKEILRRVARERSPSLDPEGLTSVFRCVEEVFTELGYTVYRDPFTFEGRTYWNLLAQLGPGSHFDCRDTAEPVGRTSGSHRMPSGSCPFIVGAHVDAVEGSPGADDNASGVAALLEVARMFQDNPLSSAVLFVAFNLEEWGMIGSTHYANRLKATGHTIRGMVSLEMVGFTSASQSYPTGLAPFYPREGNFIGVGANWRSRRLLKRFAQGMRQVPNLKVETIALPGNGGLVPAIRLSDHAPFWDCGYPALLVTDTSFYRNPHYHSPSDTIDTLDLEFLAKVTEGVYQGVIHALSDTG